MRVLLVERQAPAIQQVLWVWQAAMAFVAEAVLIFERAVAAAATLAAAADPRANSRAVAVVL